MRQSDAQSSRLHPFWLTLADLVAVIRLLRGPILASIAAAVILYLPDQIREIYRIDAADRGWRDIGIGIVALTLMCVSFWWVSFRIVHSLGYLHYPQTKPARALMLLLPGVIGALPLAGCGAGLLASQPAPRSLQSDLNAMLERRGLQSDLESPWAGRTEEIGGQIVSGLNAGATVLFVLAALVLATALFVHWRSVKASGSEHRARDSGWGFFSILGLLVSLAIVAGVTAIVIAFPVAVPTAIGTLPLVALFFIAIILMAGQLTFWHEATRMPFFILLAIAALGFAAFDLNDNHESAAVTDPAKAAPYNAGVGDTWNSFEDWYKARPNRDQYKATYPVYVVAAQGGGIYAAYHAATLLGRLQDRCPEFRNHLFAISSVSGGSLGAAVFASAVKALAAADPGSAKGSGPGERTAGQSSLPCPSMEHAGLDRALAQIPGPHEQAASRILASDFLSPLVAGTLFPDFTQRFLPFPVEGFDRARWLERAFERAWSAGGLAGPNPFEESVSRMWSGTGPAPALLINTTESDSGRRLVIAPFSLGRHGEVLLFPLKIPRRLICQDRDISLSTAVGLSARFPWLTPAGSLTTDCREFSKRRKSRLVDGGYLDNSGVETALDVIASIEDGLARNDGRVDGKDGPRIELHLIVLTTSEVPERAGYGLGDALEPIRALLSTREVRTPIAVSRAEGRLAALRPAPDKVAERQLHRLHVARFHNPIYQMPLGWRISKASRDIIDLQNGRFWECDPSFEYHQRASDFSNADCIQMIVYHHLNETMADELRVVYLPERISRESFRVAAERFPHKALMTCYSDALRSASRGAGASGQQSAREPPAGRGLQRRQGEAIDWLLKLWDGSPQFTDDRWLAYLLAVVDYDAGAIPFRQGGCLSEKCALRHLQDAESGADARLLAPEPNGNRYYGRGFVQLSLPENYRRVAEITHNYEPVYDHPDLLLSPSTSTRVLFAWMTDPRLSPDRTLDKFTTATGFDLERALGAHLGGAATGDSPAFRGALASVKPSYGRFMACIAAAKAAK
jgi:hypothetical protein